jgi:hypothetical protein
VEWRQLNHSEPKYQGFCCGDAELPMTNSEVEFQLRLAFSSRLFQSTGIKTRSPRYPWKQLEGPFIRASGRQADETTDCGQAC